MKYYIGLLVVVLAFIAGVGVGRMHNRAVPIHTHQLNLEFELGERVLVMDYSVGGKRVEVPGVITGWGLTDFDLTGKEEVHYFVSTNQEHAAHGYKAKEVTRLHGGRFSE